MLIPDAINRRLLTCQQSLEQYKQQLQTLSQDQYPVEHEDLTNKIEDLQEKYDELYSQRNSFQILFRGIDRIDQLRAIGESYYV